MSGRSVDVEYRETVYLSKIKGENNMTKVQKALVHTVSTVNTIGEDTKENLMIASLILSRIPKKTYKRLEKKAFRILYSR